MADTWRNRQGGGWNCETSTACKAVAAYLRDGDTAAFEGFTHLIPHAAAHEAVRQGRKELTLVRMKRVFRGHRATLRTFGLMSLKRVGRAKPYYLRRLDPMLA